MAWTTTDVETLRTAIRAAIANGTWQVQTIAFSDQAVTLRSLKEAMDLLDRIEAQVNAQGGGLTKYVQTSKGL